jgi:hypothetical protein
MKMKYQVLCQSVRVRAAPAARNTNSTKFPDLGKDTKIRVFRSLGKGPRSVRHEDVKHRIREQSSAPCPALCSYANPRTGPLLIPRVRSRN